ncbi:MazG nucleotide pyrophosphohydrolase [Acidimicrobium ferrooxidans DSM 10331]|uniref:MazG nucleotide pyrophosphohydrolase n=1 Tax=Acidimicrobium ferrooxidans (strain DSM 10331 / JCM 15462 / NBRC 103882 / ICP) TaxID=525909 RepID=C7M0K4_ACIFD|nr:MazG nucleotide pyrophosphohydrolase domain-containing protein [Acidimicrobium ferrooxidans]ACU54512.1 MazG nucleotide pyrophosphohydrolase [Acidimicrobium ferrooxidans DSM 10331]
MKPIVRVVGCGAGRAEAAALGDALEGCVAVVARSLEHPGLAEALGTLDAPILTCDDLYAASTTFEECYERIVERLRDLAFETGGPVGYVVPGSPQVAERTVVLLRRADDIDVEILAGRGVLELIIERFGVDPLEGLSVVDAEALHANPWIASGTVVALQVWHEPLARDLVVLAERSGARAVLAHHLGLDDEVVAEVDSGDERLAAVDHLSSVVLTDFEPPSVALGRLGEVVSTLRSACPWDASQTHRSLARHLIEEAYEAVDALDAYEADGHDRDHVVEELGDVLLQVLMHATIADEDGSFDLIAIARALTDKLIRRHPHVFGDAVARSAGEVEQRWEAIKAAEQPGSRPVPVGLPASLRLAKLARRARARDVRAASLGRGDDLAGVLVEAALSGVDVDEALRDAARRLERALGEVDVDAGRPGNGDGTS